MRIRELLIAALLFVSEQAYALGWIEGRVVNVTDGDGITLEDARGIQWEIRLFAIDAPETTCHYKSVLPKKCIEQAQPGGLDSKINLSKYVLQKIVSVKLGYGTSFNRVVGIVYLDGEDINLRQIIDGYAWHEKNFAHRQTPQERKAYSTAQDLAQARQIGIWAFNNPEAPWKYRRRSVNHQYSQDWKK